MSWWLLPSGRPWWVDNDSSSLASTLEGQGASLIAAEDVDSIITAWNARNTPAVRTPLSVIASEVDSDADRAEAAADRAVAAATAVGDGDGGGGTGATTVDGILDATTVGKAVMKATDAAAARTAIGAGTSSFSGSYDDLDDKPGSTPTDWSDINDKPATFPPTIGTSATTALAGNTAIPNPSDGNPRTLGTAAAGGGTAYSRYDHVHPMPSAGDVGAATAAQGSKADSAVQPGDLAAVASSGAYGDLTGKPTLGTAAGQNSTAFATAAQGAKADTALQPAVVGAASGIAALDASSHIAYATLPIGAAFHVVSTDGGTTWKDAAGTTISARPSSRTDLRMICETTGTTMPSFAISGDLLFEIAS